MTDQPDVTAIRKALQRETYPVKGVRYVVRPDARLREPGDDQDGPSNPTPAGDPQEAVRLLRKYLRQRAKVMGDLAAEDDAEPVSRADAVGLLRAHHLRRAGQTEDADTGQGRHEEAEDEVGERLPAPLPEARRIALESRLGVPLPPDLRALYAVADGDGQAGLFQRLSWWVDLEGLVKVHRGDRHWAARDSRDVPHLSFRPDTQPPGLVRRSSDRAGWVPFMLGTGGDYLAVDMDPGPNGRPGQVIRIGDGSDDGAVHVADSVTALLRELVDALTTGNYTRIGDEPYIEIGADSRDTAARHQSIGNAGPLRETLRPAVQRLTVTAAGDVDLEPVRNAPILRWVQLSGATRTDLAPLRDTPVEILDLDVKTIDLAPLAGHPTLETLALRSAEPVDLTPLRTCPRLHALDLSNAPGADLAPIADLPGLRYLALRHRQWLELWQRTDRLPPIAVAFLAGKASQDAAVEWAIRLRATVPDESPYPEGGMDR